MFLINRMAKYIRRNWKPFLLNIGCIVALTYLRVYIPQLSGDVIRSVLEMGDFSLLVSLVIQMIALTGVLGFFSFLQRYSMGYFSQRIEYEVRNDVFKAIQRQSFGFFDTIKTGQLMSRATGDIYRIRNFTGWQLGSFIDVILLLVGVTWSMLSVNLELTLISFSILPIFFISWMWFAEKIRVTVVAARNQFGNLTSVLSENIMGIRVVRSFAREDYEKHKFDEPNQFYYKLMRKAVEIRAFSRPLQSLVGGLPTIAIYWYGGLQIISGVLTIDQLFVFSVYVLLLIGPLRTMGTIVEGYQRMVAAGERVFEIIDAVPEIRDKSNAVNLPPIQGHVIFEDVSFGYNKKQLILEKVKLEAKRGETIALLGPTGSGKSTVIRLLPRFYDVTSGKILVDGYDVREVTARSLRNQISTVSQETFLFNRTVRENIAYGKPEAKEKEIIKVAKIARAHDFIMNLPKGYNTIIGERGVTLSGGQQQRISIARALLTNSPILILDDSTSSVDVDTEHEIQQALSALLRNRTTFVITQRLSTIRNAEKIYVLEKGRIVEEGNHKSLISRDGVYNKIYQTLHQTQKDTFAGLVTENNEYSQVEKEQALNGKKEEM